jgi:hypothetical protein
MLQRARLAKIPGTKSQSTQLDIRAVAYIYCPVQVYVSNSFLGKLHEGTEKISSLIKVAIRQRSMRGTLCQQISLLPSGLGNA